jgi:hypothetical protein
VLPLVVFFITRRVCRELQRIEQVENTREVAETEGKTARAWASAGRR